MPQSILTTVHVNNSCRKLHCQSRYIVPVQNLHKLLRLFADIKQLSNNQSVSSEEVLCRNNGEGSSRAGRRSCALRLVRPSIPTGTSLIRLRLVRCLSHHNCVKSGNKSDFFFLRYDTGTVLTLSALGYCSLYQYASKYRYVFPTTVPRLLRMKIGTVPVLMWERS